MNNLKDIDDKLLSDNKLITQVGKFVRGTSLNKISQ
jgi:lipopolysaccharide/colanic/teichoic acid biosynthesis glycosyltransferase